MKPKCDKCDCTCYYCTRGHNSGEATCVFGHASYCVMRLPFHERKEALYQPKHMKVE